MLSKENEYHEQDFGFTKLNDKEYLVYLDLPDFGIRYNHDDGFYSVKDSKVGVIIYQNYGDVSSKSRAHVLGKNIPLKDLCGTDFGGTGSTFEERIVDRLRIYKAMVLDANTSDWISKIYMPIDSSELKQFGENIVKTNF